jgi:hypothetical protein
VRATSQVTPRVSVIIPAHNEETVLARSLSTLLRGAAPGEFDVIVVANGCTDATAEVAKACGVRVLETSTPGKVNALRLGDQAATVFPRLYADADVELTAESVRVLLETLTQPGVLATSPVPHYELSGVRSSARRLHRVHELLMSGRRGLEGAGAYCLTEAGHARVTPFPDVISDDGFVNRSFASGERVVSTSASSIVRPSLTLRATLRRRVRVRQGNRQLDAMGLPRPDGRVRLRALLALIYGRSITPLDACMYLALHGAVRFRVRWRQAIKAKPSWGMDLSSR